MVDLGPIYHKWQDYGSSFHNPGPSGLLQLMKNDGVVAMVTGLCVVLSVCLVLILMLNTTSFKKIDDSLIERLRGELFTVRWTSALVVITSLVMSLMGLLPLFKTTEATPPSETPIQYIGREIGAKDLVCSTGKNGEAGVASGLDETRTNVALNYPIDGLHRMVKIPNGIYECQATISGDAGSGDGVMDMRIRVHGNKVWIRDAGNSNLLAVEKSAARLNKNVLGMTANWS